MSQQQPQPSADIQLAKTLARLPDAVAYVVVARIGDKIELVHKGGLGEIMVLQKIVEEDAFRKQFAVANGG